MLIRTDWTGMEFLLNCRTVTGPEMKQLCKLISDGLSFSVSVQVFCKAKYHEHSCNLLWMVHVV
jgi:hypothetical protein